MTTPVATRSVFDDALGAIRAVRGFEQVRCSGRISELLIGNGFVITEYLADLLVQAQQEVLLATCFWTASPSLSLLRDALITLNNRAGRDRRRVTVQILVSSLSLAQKFLSFRDVRKWKSNTWHKLGLPNPLALDWLDLTIVSRFKKPIGLMHAKFMIIDRQVVILPSSNISCSSPSRSPSSHGRGELV
jgi:phosphatidylserine/phosphatidylglycerophosphate/cardiolipin synthase-like enzyme